MKLSKSIALITVGSILFIFGGYLAFSFFNFEIGIMTITIWRDVIIFSIISIIGLAILLFGIRKLIRNKSQTSQ